MKLEPTSHKLNNNILKLIGSPANTTQNIRVICECQLLNAGMGKLQIIQNHLKVLFGSSQVKKSLRVDN